VSRRRLSRHRTLVVVAFGEQDVVLTLPTGARFREAARSAIGELARRRGFSPCEGEQLETAVDRTLDLLLRHPGDGVRFRFGARAGDDITVEAERTAARPGNPAAPGDLPPAAVSEEVARFRSGVAGLVDAPEVDPGGARVRFCTRPR
jgi:hypothetical protein